MTDSSDIGSLFPVGSNLLDIFERLMAEIGIVQLGVMTSLPQQRLVRALLDDRARLHHNNAIGVTHRPKTVGDHNAGARPHYNIKTFLNLRFGKWVNAG